MRVMFLTTLFCLALMPTCERATEVKLEGGNPPTFVVTGSGELSALIVYGPKQRELASDRAFALWEIRPRGGRANARQVEDISTIKYGVVPAGYEQVFPEDSAAPPALVAGERYEYWFQTVNAPHARAHFEIRNNKAVKASE